jgi:hypothetical protein
MQGCSLTPTTAADKFVTSLAVAEQSLTTAVSTHAISVDQAKALLPYLEAVRCAKATMVAAAENGDTSTYQAAQAAASSALTTLETQLAAAEAAGKAPTTAPSK